MNRIRTHRTAAGMTAAAVLLIAAITAAQGSRAKAEQTPPVLTATEQEQRTTQPTAAGCGSALILEEKTPPARQYAEIPFIPLPVECDEATQEVIFGICKDHGVAFPLVVAIIERESHFDAEARSATGDSGMMQINDCNLEALAAQGYENMFDLYDNVSAGAWMLSELFKKHEDTTLVLMCYNMGERGAQDALAAGVTETDYTREITSRAQEFTYYIDHILNSE